MKFLAISMAGALALLLAIALVTVFSGIYNVAADIPHTRLVYSMMSELRDRSIDARAGHIKVPPLADPALVLKGAGQYAAMCTGCHLTPGGKDSEIRAGLYPQPPDLAREHVDPRRAFWVIKHGVKMSAMPAWGKTHDDPTIWSMVAFLEVLPGMTAAQYRDMVSKAPPDEDMDDMPHESSGAVPGSER